MKLGKELFLELVRVPFQLCAARIRVVVLENELTGNQAQLQRITRRWRRRRRGLAFLAISRDGLTEGHVKELVEVDAFDKARRINLRVVDQVSGVERIRLFPGDEREARRRSPTHKRPADVDTVVIVSPRDRSRFSWSP